MPKPYSVMKRQIRDRLRVVTGGARIAEMKRILKEIPPLAGGPYGTMRKELMAELDLERRKSRHSQHGDAYRVEREGLRTFALVGGPNSGKSALFTALTGRPSRQDAYEFTTKAPVVGLFAHKDAKFQVVDLPSLPLGRPAEGRLLEFIHAQHMFWVLDLTKELKPQMDSILPAAGNMGGRSAVIVGNKSDASKGDQRSRLGRIAGARPFLAVSAATGAGIEELKAIVYGEAGVMRIFLRVPGALGADPVHMAKGSSVRDVVEEIHRGMLDRFKAAHVWGKSVKFEGQAVSLAHRLKEDDVLELSLRA